MKVCQLGLLVLMMGASQAFAADGLPSQATLAAMGLGELRVMSDSEGLAIRGLGYQGVSAAGKSWAAIAGSGAAAGSQNSYDAKGSKAAGGHNVSFASLEIKKSGGGNDHGGGGYDNRSNSGHGNSGHGNSKPQSIKISVIAGGASGGYTKR